MEVLFSRHHIMFSVIKEVNGEPYCDIVPSTSQIFRLLIIQDCLK